MKNKMNLAIGFAALLSLAACTSVGDRPGWEYAPDMYYAKGYEPYSQSTELYEYNPYGMSLRTPVEGTVSQGHLDDVYPYENTPEGYEAAAALQMPESADLEHGKERYIIYCAPCHGEKGGNDGEVFKRVKTLAPAWKGYTDDYIKSLAVGKIYHTLMYGKNNMGSHSSVLSPADRWAVIKYVKFLSNGATGASASTAAPSTTDSATIKGK